MYVEAGVFSTDSNGHLIGYDIAKEDITGAVGMGEIGYKTDFTTEAYPARFSLTAFVNTSSHPDYNAAAAFNPASTATRSGTSGIAVQGQKVVWRADGGTVHSASPTSIAIYGSFGQAFDSTSQIQSSLYVGATLQSPFAGRPGDRFGVKFNWERLNPNYASYLNAANFVSGGPGNASIGNEYVFEANAHIQLPGGLAFEPVFQYAINPNSFYNPLTANRPHSGVFLIGTLVIPVGTILGLQPGQ
jgi:porin